MASPYLLWLLTAANALAGPSSPLPVHALVVGDPVDTDGALLAERVGWLLQTAGYVVLDADLAQGRVGETPAGLRSRCGADVACWRNVGRRAGLEQVVLVDRLDDDTFGLAVVDVGAQSDFRRDTAALTGGWPDPGLVDRLFVGAGALRISGLPETAIVQIDGGPSLPAPYGIAIDPVTAGKHGLEFTAEGHATLWMSLMVYPDQETAIDALMFLEEPEVKPRKPLVGWVGGAVLVGGVAALIVARPGSTAGTP